MGFCFIPLNIDDIMGMKNIIREEEKVKNDNHMCSHFGMFMLHISYREIEEYAVKLTHQE